MIYRVDFSLGKLNLKIFEIYFHYYDLNYQRQLAESWGYADGKRLAVEKFMQAYYRWASTIGQLNEILIQHFEQAILRSDSKDTINRIDDNFVNKNGYLELYPPQFLLYRCESETKNFS